MLRDSVIAAIRTGVAAVVGLLITWLLSQGLELPEEFQANLTAVVVVLVTAAYNWGVILLERNVHPYFGILLGVPKSPAYGETGTQTPPPVKDSVPNDRGAVSYVGAGIGLLVFGIIFVLLFTGVLDTIGIIAIALGLVAIVLGLVTSSRSRV